MSEVKKFTDDEVMPAVFRFLDHISLEDIQAANTRLGDELREFKEFVADEEIELGDSTIGESWYSVWGAIKSYCDERQESEA